MGEGEDRAGKGLADVCNGSRVCFCSELYTYGVASYTVPA